MMASNTGGRCEFEVLAAGAALNALEPEEDTMFAQHLPDCARCREAFTSSKEAASFLGANVPQEEPPARLRERILAEAARTPQLGGRSQRARRAEPEPVGSTAAVRRLEPRRSRGARMLTAAAAVLAIAVISVLGVRVGQLSGEQDARAAQSRQMSRALGVLNEQDASMTVLRSGSGDKVATLVSGGSDAAVLPGTLRPNDADHIYVLWGMSRGKPVAVSSFRLDDGPVRSVDWSNRAGGHRDYAISLEQGDVAPPAPSTVLATGSKAA